MAVKQFNNICQKNSGLFLAISCQYNGLNFLSTEYSRISEDGSVLSLWIAGCRAKALEPLTKAAN